MDTLPALHDDVGPQIAGLAQRYRRANGPVLALLNRFGNQIDDALKVLPPSVRNRIENATAAALDRAFSVAVLGRHAPALGPRAAQTVAMLTGAAGGVGGLPTALAEIPVTVTVFLHAIARAAETEGFDPDAPEIRAECLRVLSAGSPLAGDDAVNTAFLSARLTLTGPAVSGLVATLAPGLAAILTRRLAAQMVPILGAVTGAALNAAYLGYYRELAAIRFALLRLGALHGAERVVADFARAVEPARVTQS
ncbi:MAG: EcsC family protein [Gemmobacter sp.]